MRTFFKNGLVGLLGLLSFVYLLNPTLGVFELLPDNLPLIGNLDEATATAILLASLSHFGCDLQHCRQLFGFGPRRTANAAGPRDSGPNA